MKLSGQWRSDIRRIIGLDFGGGCFGCIMCGVLLLHGISSSQSLNLEALRA